MMAHPASAEIKTPSFVWAGRSFPFFFILKKRRKKGIFVTIYQFGGGGKL